MPPLIRRLLSEAIPVLALIGFSLYYMGFLLREDIVVFGGSPGQFFRFWYPLDVSFPRDGTLIDWNPFWYAGYPELQFYPPGFVLLGLVIKFISFGNLSTVATYQAVNFLAYLIPGLTVYLFFRSAGFGRVVGLASGFFALVFPDLLGGVGAIFDGMLGDRLALGLFPLAFLAGMKAVDGKNKVSWTVVTAVFLAAIVLLHPFQAVSPVLALTVYALSHWLNDEKNKNLRSFVKTVPTIPFFSSLLAIILTSFWLVPLVVYSKYATPVLRVPFDQIDWWLFSGRLPFFAILACFGINLALRRYGRQRHIVLSLAITPVIMGVLIVFDYVVLIDRLHFYSLDPVRFVETIYLTIIMLAGIGFAQLAIPLAQMGRLRQSTPASSTANEGVTAAGTKFASFAIIVILLYLVWQPFPSWLDNFKPERAGEPRLTSTAIERYRLDRLWSFLKGQDEGRILFTSSQFRLRRSGSETLPTYLMALTPLMTGRETIGGTFHHWSPLATFYWYGYGRPQVMRDRTDLMDDQSIFGMKWSSMNENLLFDIIKRLNITSVVASDYDVWARTFLDRSPRFKAVLNDPEYVVYRVVDYAPCLVDSNDTALLAQVTDYTGRDLKIHVNESAEGSELTVKITEYPLWRARANGLNLPIGRDEMGLMRLTLPALTDYDIEMTYEKGPIEKVSYIISFAATGICLGGLLLLRIRRSR